MALDIKQPARWPCTYPHTNSCNAFNSAVLYSGMVANDEEITALLIGRVFDAKNSFGDGKRRGIATRSVRNNNKLGDESEDRLLEGFQSLKNTVYLI